MSQTGATAESVNLDKELLQRRHYFLLDQLQQMTKLAPVNVQPQLTHDLLTALSASLLDGTVFEIAKNLNEMQQINERELFTERTRLANDYQNQRNQLMKRHKTTEQACENKPHHMPIVTAANKRELELFEKRMQNELQRLDMKIVQATDQKVKEQQETMQQAGVPGFHVTTQPSEIRLQMQLLQFIQRLEQMKMP